MSDEKTRYALNDRRGEARLSESEFRRLEADLQHDDLSRTQLEIVQECDAIRSMLLGKNRRYGDSALNPARIFSQADPVEQIRVRIDDKLSRIMSGQSDDTEDAELDLIGYLVLLRIARRRARPVEAML